MALRYRTIRFGEPMSRVLITAATIATLLSVVASAQEAVPAAAPATTELEKSGLVPPTVLSEGYAPNDQDRLASKLIGAKIYSSAADNADEIGTVGDLVLNADNRVTAAVVDVGGFLGIGQKSVAVDMGQLQRVKAADGTSRYVMTTTAEALKAAPAFIWADSEAATGKQPDVAAEASQLVPGDPNAVADPNDSTDQPEATPLDRTTLQAVELAGMTPDQLRGLAVYGIDDQIGSVSDVLVNTDGSIDALIVDVGGFLGLGAKPVAVGFANLNVSSDVNGTDYVFVNATKDVLETQPAYDAATYPTERAAQRLEVKP